MKSSANPLPETVARRCSAKKIFLNISQNSLENTCVGSLFFNKIYFLYQHVCHFLLNFFYFSFLIPTNVTSSTYDDDQIVIQFQQFDLCCLNLQPGVCSTKLECYVKAIIVFYKFQDFFGIRYSLMNRPCCHNLFRIMQHDQFRNFNRVGFTQ